MDNHQKRGNFSGSLGFVLAAAGSAVGLGNIWRFPYLAAKNGGTFILVYVILALTFGFALLTSEIAIGRKTGLSPLKAYGELSKKWKWIGVVACIVPIMILPYYSVIGGWIIKYLIAFLDNNMAATVADGYFTGFITAQWAPIIWFAVFMLLTMLVVYKGVNQGIEKISTILMPVLVIMVIGIAIFSLTLTHTDADGTTRTGLQGLAMYITPKFDGLTFKGFLNILMDAMGQLFYSISVAMGIMITYGSYVKKETNLAKSVNQIEFFDTLVAILAGLMIVPAVFTFMGAEGMTAGPSLMFVSLPKVFAAIGPFGNIIGAAFFLMVLFAALTSSISLMEAVVSCLMDAFKLDRKKAVLVTTVFSLIVGIIVCLGYNVIYFEFTLPNGSVAQVLDVLDYISNYVLMPVVAISTCILIGWVLRPKAIIDEITFGGIKFGREKLYTVMVKYITPILLLLLLLQSFGIF